jgi:hypothetical protein
VRLVERESFELTSFQKKQVALYIVYCVCVCVYIYIYIYIELGTRWGRVVRFTLRPRFIPGERTHATHCTVGWVGPRAVLNTETRAD